MSTLFGRSIARWPVVTAQELLPLLGNGKLKFIDASWYLPAMNRNALQEFAAKRIPHAVFWGIDEIADKTTTLPHMLPNENEFAGHMSRLGVSHDVPTIVYDGHGFFSAARAFWTLATFGHTSVGILEGGLPAWQAAGGPIETGEPTAPSPSPVEVWKLDSSMVVQGDEVRDALHSRAGSAAEYLRSLPLMIDARPAGRFAGTDPEPRPGIRSGHAPTSRSVPFSSLLDPTRHNALLPPQQLKEAFLKAGVDPSRPGPIVTSCGSGVTAAVLYAALASLGRPVTAGRTRLYDGSWAEWASMQGDGFDIVTGPAEEVPAEKL